MWTLQALLKRAEDFFKEKGIDSPRLEAELLLAHSLSCDRIRLYTDYRRPVVQEELDRFRSLTLRRADGEPSAYLTGNKEFFSLSFSVNQDVLIPRPETEELVQFVLDRIPGEGEGWGVADICTGSGCIPVTLLKLRPSLQAIGIDISPGALEVAGRNAERHHVDDRVAFYSGNLLRPLEESNLKDDRYDFITCNPPYVDPDGPWPVDREVRKYEPESAVFSPAGKPTFYYGEVLDSAHRYLKKEGVLVFELGAGLKEAVMAEGEKRGWRPIEVRADLAGMDRVIAFTPSK